MYDSLINDTIYDHIEGDFNVTRYVPFKVFENKIERRVDFPLQWLKFMIVDYWYDPNKMNLSSFIEILKNLHEVIPDNIIHEYCEMIEYCKIYDMHEFDDMYGQFNDYKDYGINRNQSVLNTFYRIFSYGTDFLPFNIVKAYDEETGKAASIMSIPIDVINCIFHPNNEDACLFKALEILSSERNHIIDSNHTLSEEYQNYDLLYDYKKLTLDGEICD